MPLYKYLAFCMCNRSISDYLIQSIHTGHLRQGHHSCPPTFVHLAKLLMSLVITAHQKRYNIVIWC